MAALVDFADYRKRLSAPREVVQLSKAVSTNVSGRLMETWNRGTFTGAIPTTPVVPTNATTGALGQLDAAAEELFCLGAHLLAGDVQMAILCDRLSHQGGLDGTNIAANITTNLPTAALTRYTSGDGVFAGVSIYTAIGSTAQTLSCTYTNEAGVGGRVSPGTQIGGTGFGNLAQRILQIPLQSGDNGFRSIESYTLSGTTGTVGNFGFTLYKPLMAFSLDRLVLPSNFSIVDGAMAGGLPVIQDGACLFWCLIGSGTTAGGVTGSISFTTV
jgi:hypothetical protein